MTKRRAKEMADVKEEIVLRYYLHRFHAAACPQGKVWPVPLPSLKEAVPFAQEIAEQNKNEFGTTILTAFKITKRLTSTADGHETVTINDDPLQPKSYFGKAARVQSRERVEHCVEADSGEIFMLNPGEKVYDRRTGKQLYREPKRRQLLHVKA